MAHPDIQRATITESIPPASATIISIASAPWLPLNRFGPTNLVTLIGGGVGIGPSVISLDCGVAVEGAVVGIGVGNNVAGRGGRGGRVGADVGAPDSASGAGTHGRNRSKHNSCVWRIIRNWIKKGIGYGATPPKGG